MIEEEIFGSRQTCSEARVSFASLAPVDPEIDENSQSEEADKFSSEEHSREQNVCFNVDV
jgi:hypothetical protein